VNQLKDMGLNVQGIDADNGCIRWAKRLYPEINVTLGDVYHLEFPDGAFDTTIFQDVVHHLDLNRALDEICRITKSRIVIYDPNPTFLVRIGRKIIRHDDPEAPHQMVLNLLRQRGLIINDIEFFEVLAMPLSGGFVGMELCPNVPRLHDTLIRFDRWITGSLLPFHLKRHLCWRYLISASKQTSA
jgi:hypothetical protein